MRVSSRREEGDELSTSLSFYPRLARGRLLVSRPRGCPSIPAPAVSSSTLAPTHHAAPLNPRPAFGAPVSGTFGAGRAMFTGTVRQARRRSRRVPGKRGSRGGVGDDSGRGLADPPIFAP